jgi:hypothetical protein
MIPRKHQVLLNSKYVGQYSVKYNHFDYNQNAMAPSHDMTDDIRHGLQNFQHNHQVLAFHGGGGDMAHHAILVKAKTFKNRRAKFQ